LKIVEITFKKLPECQSVMAELRIASEKVLHKTVAGIQKVVCYGAFGSSEQLRYFRFSRHALHHLHACADYLQQSLLGRCPFQPTAYGGFG
jgi:hypothetical protein